MTLYAAEQRPERSSRSHVPVLGNRPWWPWVWMALASLLLFGSGTVRFWQDRRLDAAVATTIAPMFPLKELPSEVGTWKLQEGGEGLLDPEVSRIAGSADSLIRNYIEKDTGVVVTVLILYGRADQVVAHTPEVCYPAIGFQLADDITEQPIASKYPALVRSTVFARKGAAVERYEVFYTFRLNGIWSSQIGGNWRTLQGSPAVFKIQVQRRAGDTERRHLNNPTIQFIRAFLPTLEDRIRREESRSESSAPANPEPTKKAEPAETAEKTS